MTQEHMPTLEDFDLIPEEKIKYWAENSNRKKQFRQLLEIAQKWRDAECTPVFIMASEGGEDEPMIIGCVAEESFGKYHH